MTFHERDPDQERNVCLGRGPRDYIRGEDGSWSPVVLVLGALLLVMVGWLLLTERNTSPTMTTTTSSGTNAGGSSKTPQEKR